ncbi:MAG TPA: diadenylate cyclase CdaA [Polyangiaceae bacterium]|nr:diadenylate cyclase CdaA [Polyangiaceae bacterium]
MLGSLYAFFESLTPLQVVRDVLDIFLVYYIVYRALLVLRGTRAMQVGMGLAMVFVLYIVAQVLQLVTVLNIMGALISSMILIIVVVFQNDIRRGLQRVGSRAWFGGLARTQESKLIDAVVEAATDLARHRIGALITFEQDANLDEFVGVHKGHVLDAQVTRELLVTLFIPEGVNKLHDGSVIIRNYRIAKAGVFFPMPEGRVVDDSFGSRHRAALGITEETDAVVVIVSEERGTISFCFNGNIASNLDGAKLRTMLEAIFSPKVRKKTRKALPKTLRDGASAEVSRRSLDTVNARRSSVDSADAGRLSRRSVESETGAHPRISLTEPEPSPARPRVRPTSEAPPPLRPSIPPPVAMPPLRTPLTASTSTSTPEALSRPGSDPDASDDPDGDDGSRQSEP